MKSVTLEEDDIKHIQMMTSRLQIMVYICLVGCSKDGLANLIEVSPTVCSVTHFTKPIVYDTYEKLILDDHLRPQKGTSLKLEKGLYTIGGSRNWKYTDRWRV